MCTTSPDHTPISLNFLHSSIFRFCSWVIPSSIHSLNRFPFLEILDFQLAGCHCFKIKLIVILSFLSLRTICTQTRALIPIIYRSK